MREVITGRTAITAEEAIDYLTAGVPVGCEVMAQNYDSDCPNYEDHTVDPDTGDEVCECWDGLTSEDVETWTDGDVVDVDGFAEWGPFAIWRTALLPSRCTKCQTPEGANLGVCSMGGYCTFI